MTLIKIKDNKSTQNIIEKFNEHIERYWNANSNKPVSFLRVNYKHDKIDYHNSYSMFKKLIQKINYFYKTKYNDYPNYKLILCEVLKKGVDAKFINLLFINYGYNTNYKYTSLY